MPFIEQLKHWADTHGERTAVVVGGNQLDYAHLLGAAESTPPTLKLLASTRPGTSRVAVVDLPTSTQLVEEFCAALLQGRTAMVLDANWPPALRAGLRQAAADWASKQDRGSGASQMAAPFLLGLSSGTSGLPKAFVRTSPSWHESFVRSVEFFGLDQDSVTLAPGPLAASMNLYALGESIFAGSTFTALPHFSPDAALQSISDNAVNRLVLVPTILELIAARGLATGRRGDGLRSIVCAGSNLSATTLAMACEWAPNACIQQYYGAAELGFVAAVTMALPAASPDPERSGTGNSTDGGVGTAFPDVQITIRDAEGIEAGPGQQGDIWVSSPYVCEGYAWGDDGLAFSALATVAERADRRAEVDDDSANDSANDSALTATWHTVRDQGYLDTHGNLHLAGRASDMIITSGANVYPHHVEQALAAAALDTGEATGETGSRHVTVVVVGIPDARRGQRVVAGIFESDTGSPGISHSDTPDPGASRRDTSDPGTMAPGLADIRAATATATPVGAFRREAAGDSTNLEPLQTLRRAAAQLPAPQRPSQYFELSALPLTGSGKISRTLLVHWISEGDSRARRIQ